MTSITQINEQKIVEHFKNVFNRLSQIQKKIFKYLHWFCRTYRTVKPSQSHIAKEVGCCRDTVVQAIKLFEKHGWIVKIKQPWKTCVYIVKEMFLLLNLNDKNTFRRIPQKEGVFSDNGKLASCVREKVESTQKTIGEQLPTLNPTVDPTIEPTPIKKYSIYTLNVNDSVVVQNTKKEPVTDVPLELDQLPISRKDKHLLSRYKLQILRLAIEDYKSYRERRRVLNIAAFLTSRCQAYRLKLLQEEGCSRNEHAGEKTEAKEVDATENKRLSRALEKALNARKARKLRVESLNKCVELLEVIPGETHPVCIGYEDVAFKGKLERALWRWLPGFNLKEFSEKFLTSKKKNQDRDLLKKGGDGIKISTGFPTQNQTVDPTPIKKYSNNTLNVNDSVVVQNTKKEPVTDVPLELDQLPISRKDKCVLSDKICEPPEYWLQFLQFVKNRCSLGQRSAKENTEGGSIA